MPSTLYPANPPDVPPHLTTPSKLYRRNAWLAMAALLAFVAAYCGLSLWFAWKAYKLLWMAFSGARDGFWLGLMGVGAAFLTLFMVKALFFVNKGGQPDALEVKPSEQPELFEFLHRLAQDTGAPRPVRVYVSPRVNASVFYDLSLINLVFPSRKNLEIGLPLVNALTVCELKAVLAHEFGHFAQRTMAVGRWVYVGQQIAAHLIGQRDGFDAFLSGLSRFDVRVAWVGWILSLVIWAIRSLAESAFKVVVLAHRALSREMELQADLVAVSVSGSEALIHALHRTAAADASWDQAIAFANRQMQEGHTISDLLAIQTRVIENMRRVLADPHYAAVPPPAISTAPHERRLFKPELAQGSRMWATHPDNHLREENSKRVFVRAVLDDTPAWAVFRDAQALRERVTAHMTQHIDKPVAVRPLSESLAALDAEFARESFNPRYRGSYLGRALARPWKEVAQMVAVSRPETPADADADYPESLSAQLKQLAELEREKAALNALLDAPTQPGGRVLMHRGKAIKRQRLPAAMAEVAQELAALNADLQAHDQLRRAAGREAALRQGPAWEAHHQGLCELLHYAEHSEAELRDLMQVLGNSVRVVTAAGTANKKGARRVIADAEVLQQAMQQVAASRHAVKPDAATAARLPKGNWDQTLGEFNLPPPYLDNINEWIRAVDSWVQQLCSALLALRRAALDQLLHSEHVLRLAAQGDEAARFALAAQEPGQSSVPNDYPRLLPGQERKLDNRLPWITRVQVADGPWPMLARLGLAGTVLVGVLGFSVSAGKVSTWVVNGLQRPVVINLDGQSLTLAPGQNTRVELESDRSIQVVTKTADGLPIESFEVKLDSDLSPKVYNVAQAAGLVEWTAMYGGGVPPAPRDQGAKRWLDTRADHVFEEPPQSIRSRSGGSTRTVLTALPGSDPGQSLGALSQPDDQRQMALAHVLWDPSDAPGTLSWIYSALKMPGVNDVLRQRLSRNPNDVLALRAQQDMATGGEREALCQSLIQQSQAAQASADLRYLAVRCLPDAAQRDAQFLLGYQQAPQNAWFAYAAAYVMAGQARWRESEAAYQVALRGNAGLADRVAVDLARIRRIDQGLARVKVEDLLPQSPGLRLVWAQESAQGVPQADPAYAIQLLQQGKLAQAWAHSEPAPSVRAHLVWMVAASEGASRERITEALAAGPQAAARANNLPVAVALAIRERKDVAPYLALIDERVTHDPPKLRQFIERLRDGAATAELESLLKGMDPHELGMASAMVVIANGISAAPVWKRRAQLLLFATERPFLG